MKKIEILSPCVCAGRNVNRGVLLDPETVSSSDLDVLIGSGLAREVERFPVPSPPSPPSPTKKGKK